MQHDVLALGGILGVEAHVTGDLAAGGELARAQRLGRAAAEIPGMTIVPLGSWSFQSKPPL